MFVALKVQVFVGFFLGMKVKMGLFFCDSSLHPLKPSPPEMRITYK
jgi:hypothetical protein